MGEMTHSSRIKKRGISTVLTTLIIVVASVVLGTAVTLFGTSLFQTGAQQTSITATNVKIFYNGTTTDTAVGAAVVRNSGDKIIAIDTINVRGTAVPFANWYYNATGASTTNIQKQFAYGNTITGTATAPSSLFSSGRQYTAWDLDRDNTADLTAPAGCTAATACALIQATGPISLNPRTAVIIYFAIPTSAVTAADVGAAVTVNISAGQVSQVQTVNVAKVS